MKKILVIIGTRPEAIKLAPVIHELLRKNEFEVETCLTGQHSEMLSHAIRDLEISVNYDLKIMQPDQTLSGITAILIEKLNTVINTASPDMIIVQGDTTTAFAGALSGFYNKVKIGHVEAGLRTLDKFAPYPEEMNRRLVSVLTDYHFAPTMSARNALILENIKESSIIVTGNTVIDSLMWIREKLSNYNIDYIFPALEGMKNQKIVLITGHRRENFGKGFENICIAIKALAMKFNNTIFIYPVHLNPNVQKPVYSILKNISNVLLIPPLSYKPFVKLMGDAYIILTDSGGIQEEAPSFGKPVLVMREVTERKESIEAGSSILIGTEPDKIVSTVSLLLTDENTYNQMVPKVNPYGDGKASIRIVDYIKNNL